MRAARSAVRSQYEETWLYRADLSFVPSTEAIVALTVARSTDIPESTFSWRIVGKQETDSHDFRVARDSRLI